LLTRSNYTERTGVSPAAHAQLATKSNYVNILTGYGTTLLGLSPHAILSTTGAASARNSLPGPGENRRTSHKAAEQKRRDSLKMCFEELRHILPPIPPDQDDDYKRPGEGNVGGQRNGDVDPINPNKGISKVALLRKSNEYVLHLHVRLARRDGVIELLRERVRELSRKLGHDEIVGGIEGVDFGSVDPEDEEPFGPIVLPFGEEGEGEEAFNNEGGEGDQGDRDAEQTAGEYEPSDSRRQSTNANTRARRRESSSGSSGRMTGQEMAVDGDSDERID
jgi:hypothetical protein